jgi:hypothetical protein
MKAIAIGALMALSVTAARAAERDSANYWLPHCKNIIAASVPATSDFYSIGECRGIIEGIAFASCADIPDAVTAGQMVRVVVRYIEARPQRMHQFFVVLAREALIDAWPCK